MRPLPPLWPEDELRVFCRAVLRAFPGTVITVSQGPSPANNRRGAG